MRLAFWRRRDPCAAGHEWPDIDKWGVDRTDDLVTFAAKCVRCDVLLVDQEPARVSQPGEQS